MRSVQMHSDGPGATRSTGVNRLMEGEKVVKDRVASGGENRLLEGNGSVNNSVKEDVNGVTGKSGMTQVDPQRMNQQPASQSIHWERFLHVRTLKVLLVETDDSTRHIVSALLRNCSYEVTAVSNGLEAWKILDDMNNQIDIVLTEVVMPGLSGIALLSKIQRTRKNTPVIMMSSHDSMGIVFKCLSKGAVDFLIKPIRKNELKNLWQHVWRKCHSSSGSGSESGVQNQKSAGSRSGGEESENDSGSRDVYIRDGSDNGSGTQSSWTKRAVDVESPQQMSPWEELSDPPDSTCAQVVFSGSEAFASNWVPKLAKEHQAINDQPENVPMDKELPAKPPRNEGLQQKELKKSLVELSAKNIGHTAPVYQKNEGDVDGSVEAQVGSKNPKCDWMKQTTDLNGVIISNPDTHRGNRESEMPFCPSKSCKVKDGAEVKAKDLPSVELTLKRAGDADIRTAAPDKSTLKHSKISAFIRYPAGSAATQTPTGNVGSCSPVENSSDAAKADTPQNVRSTSDGTLPIDMGSTTYRSVTKATEVIDKPSAKATTPVVDCANPSVIQPVEDGLQSATQSGKSNVVKDQVHHHYHHYYHHHQYHAHCLQHGSGSGSGSNHGSNMQNGSSAEANMEGTNMASNDQAAAEGVRSGSGTGIGIRLNQSISAHMEANMNKSCQKRKERCFEKRVEHQSRKKSTEQRLRARGQFVQQEQGNNREDADS